MEFPENIKENDHPIPWALKIIYALIVVWCVWYLITSFQKHGTEAVISLDQQTSIQ